MLRIIKSLDCRSKKHNYVLYSYCEPWWPKTLFLLFEYNLRIFCVIFQPCQPRSSVHCKFMIPETGIRWRCWAVCEREAVRTVPPRYNHQAARAIVSKFSWSCFATSQNAAIPDVPSVSQTDWLSDVGYASMCSTVMPGCCSKAGILILIFISFSSAEGSDIGNLQPSFYCLLSSYLRRKKLLAHIHEQAGMGNLKFLETRFTFFLFFPRAYSSPLSSAALLPPFLLSVLDGCIRLSFSKQKYFILLLNFLHRILSVFWVISTLLSIRLKTLALSLGICFPLPVCSLLLSITDDFSVVHLFFIPFCTSSSLCPVIYSKFVLFWGFFCLSIAAC